MFVLVRCFLVPPSPVGPRIIGATLDLLSGGCVVNFDRPLLVEPVDGTNWQAHADGNVWDGNGGGIITGSDVFIPLLRSGIASPLQVIDYFATGAPIRAADGTPAEVQTDVPLVVV